MRPGTATSGVEIPGVTPNGLRLLLDNEERFLPFDHFPWFKEAAVSAVLHVERPHPDHLHWPPIDVDLHIESIRHPERFPLVSRERA